MHKLIPNGATLIPQDAKRVFTGIIYDVYQWQQALFDDSMTTFEMLKRPDTVSAVCIVDGNIVVIEDDQPHRGKRVSFPGGRVDPEDISTLVAAQREVSEETGYTFANWRLVRVFQPQTKIEWFVYVYLAWDVVTHDAPKPDAGEQISIKLSSFGDVKALCQQKAGYLGEAGDMFEAETLEALLARPAFEGKEVDR